MKKLFILAILCFASLGFGEETGQSGTKIAENTIQTYGGGDLLTTVFTAIGKILYGDADGLKATFRALVNISLLIGAFCCICTAFFRQQFSPLIRSFLLPGVAIVGLLLVPKTDIQIKDMRTGQSSERITVPFALGKFAYYNNFLFHKLESLFSDAVGKDRYPWTQKFGKISPFHPQPKSLPSYQEENMREFCRECVFRDLGLGLYTRDDLRKEGDLLKFFEEKTAKNRSFVLIGPEKNENQPEEDKKEIAYVSKRVSCQEGIKKISESLGSEIKDPDGQLSSISSLLADEKIKDKNPIPPKQKLAIDFLKEEISPGFAPAKKEGVGIVSSAADSLLALRGFIEALLYLVFPLVILLALLSFGVQTLIHWTKLVLWVSIWPLFYVAVNLFLNSIWAARRPSGDLTLESIDNLRDLYGTIEIVGLAAAISVPILAWLFLKGGISQIAAMTANLTQSSQSSSIEKAGPSSVEISQRTLVQESSKQTFQGFLSPNSGRTIADLENTLQSSLSSLKVAMQDSSERVVQAVEAQEQSRMHTPTHGSWGGEKP